MGTAVPRGWVGWDPPPGPIFHTEKRLLYLRPPGPAFLQHLGPLSLLRGPSGHEALPPAPSGPCPCPPVPGRAPSPFLVASALGLEVWRMQAPGFAFWFCDPGVVASAASLAFVSPSVTQRERPFPPVGETVKKSHVGQHRRCWMTGIFILRSQKDLRVSPESLPEN